MLCCKYSYSWVIRLSPDPRADLLWWSSFFRDWIILSFSIFPCFSTVSDLRVSNNAEGAAAFGAYLDGLFGSSAAGLPRNCLQGVSFTCPSPHVWGHQWHILWVQFFCGNLGVSDTILSVSRPDGALGDLLSSWYPLHTLLGAPTPSLIFSLVHLWGRRRTLLPPPDFSSDNSPSRSSARGTEFPFFHQRGNCGLTASLAPSACLPQRRFTKFYVTRGFLHTSVGFPFPVSGLRKCLWNIWSLQYPIAP